MRDGTATKELIERTALRLFVEKGVAETTIRDIAAAAGIAEGTMYRHYASKDDLAWDLYATGYLAFAGRIEALRRKSLPLKAQLDARIRRFCDLYDDDPILFDYLLLARNRHSRRLPAKSPQPLLVLRDAIADGMKRGEIPKGDPMVAASLVLGMVLQAATSKADGRLDHSLSALANTLVSCAWRVLKRGQK